jgi:probable DNA metabolism protein
MALAHPLPHALPHMADTGATPAGCPVLVHNFSQWREAARTLAARNVPPHAVQWIGQGCGAGLASAAMQGGAAGSGECGMPRVSRALLQLLETAACCRLPDRWAFLYGVLWRWLHGEKTVLSPADADGRRLHAMARAARGEVRHTLARIRFRERREDAGPPRFVAWFAPVHDVLALVARHFAARMGRVSFMIATPGASVLWDGAMLHATGALLRAPQDGGEAGEAPGLGRYRRVFQPARLRAEIVCQKPSRPREGGANAAAASGAQEEAPASLDQCRRCDLWRHATQGVGGAGPKRARIMLVGEQPGDQEDLQGKPFVGPAGQLLDRALAQADLDRRKVYITNAVKHFKWEPRGKRRLHKTPAQREVEACAYWLERELAQVKPAVVVALGSTALKAVLGDPRATLKEAVGRAIAHEGRWVVATYHPSYALRVPDAAARQAAFAAMVEGLKQARDLSKP